MKIPKFKWVDGRQSGLDYKKMCLYSFRVGKWGFDCYLIKYPWRGYLTMHTDPIPGRHYRMNIKLYGNAIFLHDREAFSIGEFLHFFRPDTNRHGLVIASRTLKLSFGAAKFDKA